MPDIEGLTQALGGMSPQQAQQATGMAVDAIQSKQKMENMNQYRQQRLDLMRDKERRMAEQMKFEQQAKRIGLAMKKQKQELQNDLIRDRQKLTETEREYKQSQLDKMRKKAKTLKNLNQEMSIPGTDDTMKAGAAIRAGVFGDLITENAASIGMSFENLPTSVQEYEYLKSNFPEMSDDVAMRKSGLTGDRLENILSAMKLIQMRKPEEAATMIEEIRKSESFSSGFGGNRDRGGGNKTGGDDETDTVTQEGINLWLDEQGR